MRQPLRRPLRRDTRHASLRPERQEGQDAGGGQLAQRPLRGRDWSTANCARREVSAYKALRERPRGHSRALVLRMILLCSPRGKVYRAVRTIASVFCERFRECCYSSTSSVANRAFECSSCCSFGDVRRCLNTSSGCSNLCSLVEVKDLSGVANVGEYCEHPQDGFRLRTDHDGFTPICRYEILRRICVS